MTVRYDEKGRLHWISDMLDEGGASENESQWFFLYDQWDRLTEIKYIPDMEGVSEKLCKWQSRGGLLTQGDPHERGHEDPLAVL